MPEPVVPPALPIPPVPPVASLVPLVPEAADERPHEHGDQVLWNESHYLDAVAPEAAAGAYLRIGRLPNQGRSHVMLAVTRPGAGPVLLVDPDAPLPAHDGADLEVTAGTFRLAITWKAPLRELRVTASGTAVSHDDPAAALRAVSGRPAHVDLDLTWVTDGTPYQWRSTTRYEMPCRVTGQLTVDGERIDVDWAGQRDHSWGPRDWWALEWCWMAVHLADGSHWHGAALPSFPGHGTGYVQRDGAVIDLTAIAAASSFTPDGLFGTTTLEIEPGGHVLRLAPVGFAPVAMLADDGRISLFSRATCQVTSADGAHGVGWVEWNRQPPAG